MDKQTAASLAYAVPEVPDEAVSKASARRAVGLADDVRGGIDLRRHLVVVDH